MNELVEKAIALAVEAHRGQKDKTGQPYILHPLRVMLQVNSPEEQMAAVLHDVVEDTDHSLDDLRSRGFPERVVAAVDALTRRDGESYEQFVDRAAVNPLARKVKIADIQDNMDVRRILTASDKDLDRVRRYAAAWKRLTEPQAS